MIWIWFLIPLLLMTGNQVANGTPQIAETNLQRIKEDTPTDTYLFTINATDTENHTLNYYLEGMDAYLFKCNVTTGVVTLAFQLDYEVKQTLEIQARVSDQLQAVTRFILIIVEDCNDNAPIFFNIPYATKINETTVPGTVIFVVEAQDIDDLGKLPVSFEILEVIPANADPSLFYIEQHNQSSPTFGNIVLNGTLNYNTLSTFYQLKIKAMDRGGELHGEFIIQNNTAYVNIDVVDMPDLDPQFIGAPYVASVYEHTVLNEAVLKVSATDPDRGINADIHYYIENATVPGLFNISYLSGMVIVSGDIDREDLVDRDEQVVLTVIAQEQMLNVYGENATAAASVTIRILDINDNKPQFYNCDITDCDFSAGPESNFIGEIEEHSSVRVPVANLTIVANDPDKGENGTFGLHLRGPDADYFSVSPTRITNTGLVQVLVKDSVAIDYEIVHQMHVEIVANDTGKLEDCCSVAYVTINLIDINDHIPEFEESSYTLKVEEHCEDGISLGVITATDLDSGIFGQITYGLLPVSTLVYFEVNPSTGNITVVNGSLLDRELRSLYYATLQARDGMNATGTTFLEIVILDINDWAPEASGTYNIFVMENIDDVYVEIKAFDADEPGTNNSVIEFLLLPSDYSHNFTVNIGTGIVTNLHNLDREAIDITLKGIIILTVKLYDLGVPSLSSEVNVTINVEDLNDNSPIFSQTEYRFSVNESTNGAYIGLLSATDADQTELNNRISFLLQGGAGNFIIRGKRIDLGQYHADLTLDPEVYLDYETQTTHTLFVQAQDNGFNGYEDVSHTATATVIVQVLDLNDEPPYIDPSTIEDLFVIENRTGGPELIKNLTATDPDTIHELEFQLLTTKCSKNGHDIGSICYDWLWLAPNGQLFVNHTEEVDYEVCDLIELMLRVEDKLTLLGDRYSNNVTQRVIIVDANDNAPEFFEITDAFVVIPETTVISTEVASVKAQDKDSGENAVITFSVDLVEFIHSSGEVQQFGNIFSVTTLSESNNYTGSIRVASNLDKALQGQYSVTVRATDHGIPPLSATQSIIIFTIDDSYRSELLFSCTVIELTDNLPTIRSELSRATKASIFVAGITAEGATIRAISRANERSILSIYCVYPNGTAIRTNVLGSLIQGNEEILRTLLSLGLSVIGAGTPIQQADNRDLYGIMAGLAAVVLVLIVILITSLVCMRKSHKRKLRAVKASKAAKALPGEAVQGAEAIPGTNKFSSEGANPMLNMDMGAILDLGFEEISSVSDSASVHSDYNTVLGEVSADAAIYQEIAVSPSKDGKDREEPLAAALNDRQIMSFDNEALDTTDL
ncbi:cadherin-related family member 2 [Hyperolius riggenbachi]|uniref:cadherin-related family member 2 n=1 Tax=Hyperolius riggenbachi TaxID=752182 RepID=UPI0035A3ADAF